MEMGLPAEPCLCHAIHWRNTMGWREATVGLEAGYGGKGTRGSNWVPFQ